MPFFLPSRLIELEHFVGEKPNEDYLKIAEPYRRDIDFAFFAANFGYSKEEYEALTPKELHFLRKAWEDKAVLETQLFYNAVFTAFYNVNRPKRKKALKLWPTKQVQKGDMNIIKGNLDTVRKIEKEEGKDWIKTVYEANGLKFQGRTVQDG